MNPNEHKECDLCGNEIIHDERFWQALRAVNVHGDGLFLETDENDHPPEKIVCEACMGGDDAC